MKPQTLLLAASLVLSGLSVAHASERWAGSGTEYSPAGEPLTTYSITVTNNQEAPGVIRSEAKISAADGHTQVVEQTFKFKGNTWSDDSNLGHGGGACYGADICENYIEGKGGLAYATTIIKDGPQKERILTIILQNGKAVKMLKENLSLQP